MGGVLHDARTLPRFHILALGQKHDLVPALRHKPLKQFPVLSRKILVHEKNVHLPVGLVIPLTASFTIAALAARRGRFGIADRAPIWNPNPTHWDTLT
jgi:hypothetical protein